MCAQDGIARETRDRVGAICRSLRRAIVEQAIRPGDRLPEDALGERFGLARVVRGGVAGCCAVMLAMFGYYAAGGDALWVLIVLYFVASGFMGLVIPTTAVLGLEAHGAIAGTASALLGTLQMLTGAVVMGVVGLFTDGTPLPMVAGMAGGALVAGLLTWTTLGERRSVPCTAN